MLKLVAASLTAMVMAPLAAVATVAAVLTPTDTGASCLPDGIRTAAAIPARLVVPAPGGGSDTLDSTQLERAAVIVRIGASTPEVGTRGIEVALTAALTESTMRMLSNTSAYPASAGFANDGDGHDHDSIGLFQMRPSSGWGTVAELMDATYDARAFFGGATGPNRGSPAGLLDIPDWASIPVGRAAQAVEGSAHPDRYQAWQPAAEAILAALTTSAGTAAASSATSVKFPLPAGSYRESAPFGERINPITDSPEFHAGVDLAAPLGTPILAPADGTVTYAGLVGGVQGEIDISDVIDGRPIEMRFLHMFGSGILVHAGQRVAAGQQIGAVGTSGESTGPHLHFEIHPGGADSPAVDPLAWLAAHHGTRSGTRALSRPVCDAT